MTSKGKQLDTKNSYLLALDGDVDFQPKAIRLLVDLMKKDEELGAACGRIHPIGSGMRKEYYLSLAVSVSVASSV